MEQDIRRQRQQGTSWGRERTANYDARRVPTAEAGYPNHFPLRYMSWYDIIVYCLDTIQSRAWTKDSHLPISNPSPTCAIRSAASCISASRHPEAPAWSRVSTRSSWLSRDCLRTRGHVSEKLPSGCRSSTTAQSNW